MRPSSAGGKFELRERFSGLVDRYETSVARGHRLHGVRVSTPVLITAVGVEAVVAMHGSPDLLGDSEFAEAALRAGVSGFRVDGAEAERVRGALTALRGAVGEQHVESLFSRSELTMPGGTAAARLTTFTEPGADIVFRDRHGDVIDLANVKVAATAQVIAEHFGRYPNVRIVYASSDAAADAAHRLVDVAVIGQGSPIPTSGKVVVDVGRSSGEFDADIDAAIDHLAAGWDDYLDWLDQIPWISGGMVAYRVLRRMQAGEGRAQALKEAGRDTVKVTIGKGAGAAASTITSSEPTVFLLAAASTALTTAVLDVRESWDSATQHLRHLANQAEELLERYDPDYACPSMKRRRRVGDAVTRLVPRTVRS